MAFGAGIREERIQELTNKANKDLSEIDFGSRVLEVDAIFEIGDSFSHIMKAFANLTHLYGNGIPEPTFVTKLLVRKNDFAVMGQSRNTFKIMKDGVSFIKFRSGEDIEIIEDLINKSSIGMEVLGKAKLNTYNGNTSVQVIVDDFNFIDAEEERLF